MSAVDGGKGQLGLAQSDVVYPRLPPRHRAQPVSAQEPARDRGAVGQHLLRAGPARQPFRSIEDLKGQRVGIIPPGTSGEFSTRIVLGAHGMSYADVQPIFEPTDSLVPKLGSGEIDAVFSANPLMLAGGPRAQPDRPAPPAADWPHRDQPAARQLSVPQAGHRRGQPASGQSQPIETLGAEWLLVCRSDLSEDLVYQLTREFFEQLPAMARDHGEAALIDPEQAPAAPIPLHAGAARYYREREILR